MTLLDRIGHTPLVRLDRVAAGLPVPVYGKCEFLNPGGSVKDRIARAIVDDAEARGLLRARATLIEATAGNTGLGLALVAAVRGYRLVCVMPAKMCADRRAALERSYFAVVLVESLAYRAAPAVLDVGRGPAGELVHIWLHGDAYGEAIRGAARQGWEA